MAVIGLADWLLQPVGFATSTALDKLRGEQQAAAPAVLRNGVSADAPLRVKSADGSGFGVAALRAEESEDGKG